MDSEQQSSTTGSLNFLVPYTKLRQS